MQTETLENSPFLRDSLPCGGVYNVCTAGCSMFNISLRNRSDWPGSRLIINCYIDVSYIR